MNTEKEEDQNFNRFVSSFIRSVIQAAVEEYAKDRELERMLQNDEYRIMMSRLEKYLRETSKFLRQMFKARANTTCCQDSGASLYNTTRSQFLNYTTNSNETYCHFYKDNVLDSNKVCEDTKAENKIITDYKEDKCHAGGSHILMRNTMILFRVLRRIYRATLGRRLLQESVHVSSQKSDNNKTNSFKNIMFWKKNKSSTDDIIPSISDQDITDNELDLNLDNLIETPRPKLSPYFPRKEAAIIAQSESPMVEPKPKLSLYIPRKEAEIITQSESPMVEPKPKSRLEKVVAFFTCCISKKNKD